jgi:hypothetical protein
MMEVTGIAGDRRFRQELIEITKRLAPEKLGAVLESLSPVGLTDLMKFQSKETKPPTLEIRTKGKELLEQALSIFK